MKKRVDADPKSVPSVRRELYQTAKGQDREFREYYHATADKYDKDNRPTDIDISLDLMNLIKIIP